MLSWKDSVENVIGQSMDEIMPTERLFFGDYMIPGADPRIYEEIPDLERLRTTVVEYLSDYNAESKSPMPLVLFLDAVEHVSRISRVLRQPKGNTLLLGVGGSGRQSLRASRPTWPSMTYFRSRSQRAMERSSGGMISRAACCKPESSKAHSLFVLRLANH